MSNVPKQLYNRQMRYSLLLLFVIILSACSPASNPNSQMQQAVAATLAAIPTITSAPRSTPYPSPTPFDLRGLFCEYQFCIGHPVDLAFFDVNARTNPAAPSSYSQGMLTAFNGNLFIQLIWQLSSESADPQFILDLILDQGVDSRTGNLDVKLIHNMNVVYTPITSTASTVLPFGAAGAWICGERAFAWKLYSPQTENAQVLFDMAINRFRCNQ